MLEYFINVHIVNDARSSSAGGRGEDGGSAFPLSFPVSRYVRISLSSLLAEGEGGG
jgi:hypothetical protein